MPENTEKRFTGEFFRTTHWSVVLQAGGTSDVAHSALEKLCNSYWYPIYGFVRRRGYDPHQSQDLTQEFFARLLSANSLESADRSKGKFRTFLLGALKNFLAKEWRDEHRLKRGGGVQTLSWDGMEPEERYKQEPADALTADAWFDRRWAQMLVTSSLERLGIEMEQDGIKHRFDLLKVFLQGDGGGLSYAAAGQQLGLSEPAIKTTIFRMRRRYGELIREEISQTVTSPEEVEDEIQNLISLLSAA